VKRGEAKRPRATARAAVMALAIATLLATPIAGAAEEDVLVELHFQPVADAQIAIWIETPAGEFVQDVFVTQATGSLGIGNRSGRWDFLSSWRFPYGPRTGVLPVWAHARGKSYPALVFHDDDPNDLESLGFHENTSSPEPYYCRPLADDEHETISVDTMTCPSPATFQSDKGRFDTSGQMSVYPPRNDLTSYEDGHDHPDVMMLSSLNDLDAVTGATPTGGMPTFVTTVIDADVAAGGPLVAWIEVNLERDENADWSYEREDHFIDPRLSSYGIEYFGQPSIVYSIEFDAMMSEFAGTEAWVGYGDLDGATGTVHPPDGSISESDGSGADRLARYTLNGETFRFGVFSHGPGSGGSGGGGGGDDGGTADDGGSADDGGDDGGTPGWGDCRVHELPAIAEVDLQAPEFDTVEVAFTLPTLDAEVDVRNVRLYYRAGEMPLDDATAGSAVQVVPAPGDCSGDFVSGGRTVCEVRGLFGNHTYQVGARYEDTCGNTSGIAADEITTPAQEFAQVEGFCFVATAAYGAPWADRVAALRYFRDTMLEPSGIGLSFIALYMTYGPQMAAAIDRVPYARVMARMGLLPLTEVARLFTASARRP
jgi:hypothetical protein